MSRAYIADIVERIVQRHVHDCTAEILEEVAELLRVERGHEFAEARKPRNINVEVNETHLPRHVREVLIEESPLSFEAIHRAVQLSIGEDVDPREVAKVLKMMLLGGQAQRTGVPGKQTYALTSNGSSVP